MAWVVLASPFDLLFFASGLMHRKIFIPLSRLSYPVLLVHGIIQLYINGILRTAEYITFPRMVILHFCDFFLNFLLYKIFLFF